MKKRYISLRIEVLGVTDELEWNASFDMGAHYNREDL